jgi:hypothetical protein
LARVQLRRIRERSCFGVRSAGAPVPTTTDHATVSHEQTTHTRVRRRRVQAPLRQFNGSIEKK